MTTIKKTIAGFVGFAIALSLVAVSPAQAAMTSAELASQIAALQAQLAALSGGSMTTTTTTSSYTFTRDLTIGSTGADVTALQNWLVGRGYTIPAGATGYFGNQTKAALASYQSAKGIVPPVGYFGPITRGSVSSLADSTGGTITTTTGGTVICPAGYTCTSDTTTSTTLSGGAGDVTVTERSSGVKDEVQEGEEDVKVLGFEVEAEDSDIRVTSVKVEFEHSGSGSSRLDRYVDEVSIMFGDKVVGSADADDFSEDSDVYSRNIPVSGVVIKDGDKERFYVAVNSVNNVDSNDLGEDWDVTYDQMRFEDGDGAVLTDSTTGITETFTFEDLSSSGDIELKVSEDNDDINNAHTVKIDDSSDTNDVEILSFTIEADGSDLSLNSIGNSSAGGGGIAIVSSGAGVTEIANDFRLMMGDEEVGTVRIDRDNDGGSDGFASTTGTTVWVTILDLDDDDVVIEKGDTVEFTLVADINDIDGAFTSGDYFDSVTLDSSDVHAEDENGDAVTDLTGSASSDDIKFQSTGIQVKVTSTPTPTTNNTVTPDTSSDIQGAFEMEFEVTAFEDTSWIALTAASSTDAAGGDYGVAFSIENASTGVAAQSGTTTAILERVSGGSTSGSFVRINAGQTAKFKLTVYHDPAAAAIYRVQMNEVGFNQTSAAVADSAQALTPASDYESASIQVLH